MVKVGDEFLGPISGKRDTGASINKTPVIVNTVYLKGDKGESAVIYPNCKYVATQVIVAADLISSTGNGKIDLAGNTTATGDRALFPIAGTSALIGIYVWSGSAWAADPAFTVIEGARVDVIRGTSGASQWRQTAASGSAVFVQDLGASSLGSFVGTLTHGGAQQTLITVAIPADTIETVGIDWQAANAIDNLTGYEEVQARRIGSASATVISDTLSSWTETSGVAAWSRQAVASGNNLIVQLTPDASTDVIASVRASIVKTNSIVGLPTNPLAALQSAFDAVVGANFDFAADSGVHVDATNAGHTDSWVSRLGSYTLANATDANQPTISTLRDGTTPSINFTGASVAQYLDVVGTVNSSSTFSLFFVYENDSNLTQHNFLATSTLWLFCQSTVAGKPSVENTADNAVCASSETQIAGFSVYEVQVDGSAKTLKVFRDGTQRAGPTSYTTAGGIGSNLRVGNYYGGASTGFGARAHICRATHIPSIPSTGDRNSIYAFLRAKYPNLAQSNPA